KVFSKRFMQEHNVPTADVYGVYIEVLETLTAFDSVDWPLVIKADGLAAGKGVLVTSSADEATEFVERAMVKREFGEAGSRVMLEEALQGEELSYIILTDGTNFIRMAPARENQIIETIVRPTLDGLRADGMPYRGFLYFGLMLTVDGPKVLEYNCRLGDPETEAVMLRAD